MELSRYDSWEDALERAKELLGELRVVPYEGDRVQHYDLDRHAVGPHEELLAFLTKWRDGAEGRYQKLCEWVESTGPANSMVSFERSFLCGTWKDGTLELCMQQLFTDLDGDDVVNGVAEVCIHRLQEGFVWYFPSEELLKDLGEEEIIEN